MQLSFKEYLLQFLKVERCVYKKLSSSLKDNPAKDFFKLLKDRKEF